MIKLLAVDDEKGITDSLKAFFGQRGFTVETANSGTEALANISKCSPHIVFLDIILKDKSGLEVLEGIKSFDKRIKVIVLSVLEDKETIDKAMSLGADDYVTKPFRLDYLEEVVIKKVQVLLHGKENE
ncbi:MAG: response regulator [Candidatus Omnitrophica bacterium]|nr:response regulator [Candidatus Omnitrophota bacterium]